MRYVCLHCLTATNRAGEIHKIKGIARDQIIGHVMAQEDVLEHILGHSRGAEGLRHALTHRSQ